MKAVCWHGKHKISVDQVSDPKILSPEDVIIKISTTAICGTDLHIYNGFVPQMKDGDILGHEFMGEVVEVGKNVRKLKKGDKVVIPSVIACGQCEYCQKALYSLCEKLNPNAKEAKKKMSQAPCAVFGYSHLNGGYPGGQAEFVRVPFADFNAIKIDPGLSDEQVLFLSDVLPTGYMAAENCEIQPGDTVAVWGCGPIGQMAIQSARLLGAERIIAIDYISERLAMAKKYGQAETIDFTQEKVFDRIMELTHGQGAHRCIDAVGTEAYPGAALDAVVDKVKQVLYLGTDRAHALREAIKCCKKGGNVSVIGVYMGNVDNVPISEILNKNLTLKSGNTHMQRYTDFLLEKIKMKEIDPSFIITHRMQLNSAPSAYELFNEKKDHCVKVVLRP